MKQKVCRITRFDSKQCHVHILRNIKIQDFKISSSRNYKHVTRSYKQNNTMLTHSTLRIIKERKDFNTLISKTQFVKNHME